MITREKGSDFEVIAVPADNISYFKTEGEHADITISVPDVHNDKKNQAERYYVLKRPASIDDAAFKVALEAAFWAVTGLIDSSPTELASRYTAKESIRNRKKNTGITNTERLEKLKKTILDDSEWLPAQEVSRRAGTGAGVKNPSGLPNRWKRAEKIFAITSEGRDLYPAYALDIGGQPLPLLKKIIQMFNETKTPWSLALWFGSPNSWLGNKKPKDLLISAPEKVLEAALRAKEGPVHG
ncbi:hypothetical protein [Pectobacterium parmentieri]|uniref:hypothetical protein n=1 Tax=Pectobacterium parmentieri TaxID=1905730 RepID=UPI0018E000B6|nr:hypothetical protein [Pectobacterium parmentieri]MBI0550210.1 hypothetical protein [Pectobacterium parmentieri]MBI0563396.1 hypothetical protein [Pectobacterium parmentieri]